jgi:hypothetical protein
VALSFTQAIPSDILNASSDQQLRSCECQSRQGFTSFTRARHPNREEASRLGLNLVSSLLNGVVDLVGSCASMGIPLSGGVARQLPA